MTNNHPINLSPRQQQIVNLMVADTSIKEMSMILSISVPTVKTHLARIRKKTQCDTTTGALAFVLLNGYINSS